MSIAPVDLRLTLPDHTVVDARTRVAVERAEASLFRHALRRSMSCGAADAFLRVAAADLDLARLASVESSGHSVRLVEPSDVTLLRPVRGQITVATGRQPVTIGPGRSLALPTGERTTTVSPDFHGLVLLLPQKQFQETLEAMAPGELATGPEAATLLDLVPGRAAAELDAFLLEQVRRVGERAAARRPDWAARAAGHALTALLAGAFLEGRPAAAAAPWQVRRAEELLRARAQHPVTIAEVCRELQLGARTLQLAFRRHRGTSPKQFLQDCRLALARDLLLRGGGQSSVIDVAYECGFGHAGRFAAAYRTRYGESPQATLRRRDTRGGAP